MDEQFTIERLSAIGNLLGKIGNVIDFEVFRNTLESKLLNTEKKNRKDPDFLLDFSYKSLVIRLTYFFHMRGFRVLLNSKR